MILVHYKLEYQGVKNHIGDSIKLDFVTKLSFLPQIEPNIRKLEKLTRVQNTSFLSFPEISDVQSI